MKVTLYALVLLLAVAVTSTIISQDVLVEKDILVTLQNGKIIRAGHALGTYNILCCRHNEKSIMYMSYPIRHFLGTKVHEATLFIANNGYQFKKTEFNRPIGPKMRVSIASKFEEKSELEHDKLPKPLKRITEFHFGSGATEPIDITDELADALRDGQEELFIAVEAVAGFEVTITFPTWDFDDRASYLQIEHEPKVAN
ncbi:hypothetical protein AKO1_005787 [Acrasis kona]|uniref:Uncharacterized protein n=1 Tax=Acrasis kona TaxID=1008807 RepID=A0AAW2YK24_9EUKA